MKAAEIDPAIQADPELDHLVRRATNILKSEIGRVQWRDEVSASWSLVRGLDEQWLRLRLADELGIAEAEFSPIALENPDYTATVMSRIWGELLRVRSHKLLESRGGGSSPDRHLDGQEVLEEIIDSVADYSERVGHEPNSLKLPIRYAAALLKLGPTYWGGFYEKIRESGFRAFDGQVLLGMKVELVPGANAELHVA